MATEITLKVEDISLFSSKGKDRSKNDANNKIRENILKCLLNIDTVFTSDPIYGSKWVELQQKFINKISTLCKHSFDLISITHLGGMKYNHDYLVSFIKNDTVIFTQKMEFKHNNSSVKKLPQILELFDRDCKSKYGLCGELSYSEYYYDNFLSKYLVVLNKNDDEYLIKPTKDIYLKYVHDITYKNKFFEVLHDNKDINTEQKKKIANESVEKYLKKYAYNFNFDKIAEKIRESQKDKVFLLWDCDNFHLEELDPDKIRITNIIKIDGSCIYLNVENFVYNICIRLRWANNNGLANPSWKIKYVDK